MKRIILVEDDLHIQDIFKVILEMNGFEVECLDSGSALYEKKDHWPDLFILDNMLPTANGVEVCQFLKSRSMTKNIPVILITAGLGLEASAKLAGADDFLEKPFDMRTILHKVSQLIDKK